MPKNTAETSTADQVTEDELVRSARTGDPQAFGALYDRYAGRVYRMVRLRVSDDMLAEDITAEIFIKAWDGLDHYEQRGYTFGAWLFTIARNAIIDHYRGASDQLPLDAVEAKRSEMNVEKVVEQSAAAEQLRKKLEVLSEDQRAVLELKFMFGMSTAEVGRTLGKKPGAVRALQMRGLQALATITEAQHD